MTIHIALLRGINVGGKNRLPMPALVGLFEKAGASDVRSYIQSGNVVFRATKDPSAVTAVVVKGIQRDFGFVAPIVLRSVRDLRAVADDNPFLAQGEPQTSLHVAFLADAPDEARVAKLNVDRSPPDRFIVRGRDVFLLLPNGVARTKLTNAWFDAQLQTTSTLRNWKTILELQRLSA